jgi:chromosome segregation ATPase
MTDQTKLRRSPVLWIGFVFGIAFGIGWFADRSRLDDELAKARSERDAARAELAVAASAPALAPAAFPTVQVERAAALPAPEAAPTELESVRSELTSARTELTATKQALSDSDDTRLEVGRKLQECQQSLNQLQAAR